MPVIVDNTNMMIWELLPYAQLVCSVLIPFLLFSLKASFMCVCVGWGVVNLLDMINGLWCW